PAASACMQEQCQIGAETSGCTGLELEEHRQVKDGCQYGGGPERGDPGGSRQEDAGEAWQRQRHHVCAHCHEHGEDNITFPGTSRAGMLHG
ncbi:unnamed protein product, partial [Tetraodon nigroviridis]